MIKPNGGASDRLNWFETQKQHTGKFAIDNKVVTAKPEYPVSMTTYIVGHSAYLKLILHAAKYPHKVVNGGTQAHAVFPRARLTGSSTSWKVGRTKSHDIGFDTYLAQLDRPQSHDVDCNRSCELYLYCVRR
jgi:hypothetical protein